VTKQQTEPFYFRSYDRVIGVAQDIPELAKEMKRLASEDPRAVEYHLSSGHIVQWLDYLGEKDLAKELMGVNSTEEALRRIDKQLQKKMTMRRMSQGRMR
jgi:hypothetical protein